MATPTSNAAPVQVAIIGSGFGGISMGWYLKQAGIESFTIYEKADSLGGVWRENTYPGAACDIASHLYSFSFEPHYPWEHRFGKRSEIISYMHHVVNKYDLARHFQFGRELTEAAFDEERGLWTLRFADGSTTEAAVLVSAVGQLHRPAYPSIPGRESFAGRAFHSARWDHDYDFNGKTVAVIGSGASAVQFVPEIARQVRQLYLFQRSPGWCIPKFDRQFTRFERALLNNVPLLYDLDRRRIFWFVESVATGILGHSLRARLMAGALKAVSRTQLFLQVRNPELRRKLTPDSPPGCKRTLLSTDWLPALCRPNVEVVTDKVDAITPTGVHTSDGQLREVDAIVYGTGFAATEFLAPMEIKGLGGRSLRTLWKDTPEAYLGIEVAGFPNFHVMYGPNTNLGAGSIIYMLEAQAQYIVQSVQLQRRESLRYLDVRVEVQDRFNEELRARTRETTYEAGCHSWYINAQGHNTNNWIGHMREYGQRLKQLNPADYVLVPMSVPAIPQHHAATA